MGIFRRGKNSDAADIVDSVDDVAGADQADGTDADDLDPEDRATSATRTTTTTRTSSARPTGRSAPRPAPPGRSTRPRSTTSDGRLDLGALRIQGVPGMELRLEIDEAANQVVGATAVIGDSAVQIQAFAAPKTTGIWDDIRSEIAESILAQGGTADEARGVLGTELRTRMPSAGPDGRTVFAPARFAGVDGPRWFLRAVFSGRAAIEDDAAEPLLDVVRSTVVVRGDGAMAPREMLLLKLPDEMQVPGPRPTTDDRRGRRRPTGSPSRVDDLKPFERGPEITEVR